MNEFLSPPDPWDITGDWARWIPVDRDEALRDCPYRKVAVLHRSSGVEMAEWFQPDSRFFRSDGPYRYDSLRYFVYAGRPQRKLAGVKVHRPEGGKEELEAMQAINAAGEAVNIGSPVKEKKKLPIQFRLLDLDGGGVAGVAYEVAFPDGSSIRGKSDPEGWIRLKDNVLAGQAKLKIIPEVDHRRKNAPVPARSKPAFGTSPTAAGNPAGNKAGAAA
jgi:hypothetical protein